MPEWHLGWPGGSNLAEVWRRLTVYPSRSLDPGPQCQGLEIRYAAKHDSRIGREERQSRRGKDRMIDGEVRLGMYGYVPGEGMRGGG